MPGITVVDNGNINVNAADPRWAKTPNNDAAPHPKAPIERAVWDKGSDSADGHHVSPPMEVDALSQPTVRAFTPAEIEDTWYRYDSNVKQGGR